MRAIKLKMMLISATPMHDERVKDEQFTLALHMFPLMDNVVRARICGMLIVRIMYLYTIHHSVYADNVSTVDTSVNIEQSCKHISHDRDIFGGFYTHALFFSHSLTRTEYLITKYPCSEERRQHFLDEDMHVLIVQKFNHSSIRASTKRYIVICC